MTDFIFFVIREIKQIYDYLDTIILFTSGDETGTFVINLSVFDVLIDLSIMSILLFLLFGHRDSDSDGGD